VVEKLVSYMIDPPPPDADARREFKYPYLACEIFCCEIDAVFQALVDDDCALFARVMSFLDPPGPLNPMLASYFSKTVGCVVARRRSETTAFFQSRPEYVDKLVDRVATLAVAEVLLRLVGADEPGVMHMGGMLMSAMGGGDTSAWLAETNLLDRLLDALGDDDETEGAVEGAVDGADGDAMTRHANAAEVLVGIARGAPSALATKLASEASMRKLFDRALSRRGDGKGSAYGGDPDAGGGAGVNVEAHEGVEIGSAITAHDGAHASPLVNVLDIAIAVVDAKRAAGPAQAMQAFLAAEVGGAEPPVREAPPEALAACVEILPRLVAFLTVDDDASRQRTTWGVMAPPLGLKRVKTVDALAVFLGSKSDAVAEAMLACDALPACFRLFHRYPFNNFLHHHVESMIDTVLEWGHPGLLARLFAPVAEGGCDVVGMIADAPQTVETARGPARSGNLGHVTRIGNKLAAVAAGGAEEGAEEGAERANANASPDAETRRATTAFLAAKLKADARWAPHVEGNLKERNAVENVYKWACGRPAGMDDDGMGEHSAEEDDHDFDVGLGGGGFTRDGFDRYGGAGLDDDDEDDEGDEDDDGPVPLGAAGLFQGDASARLASLTLSNALPGEDEDEDEDEEGGFAAGSSGFAETILRLQMSGEDFDDSSGFTSSEEDEDDVVLGDDADADEDSPTVVVPAFAPAGEDEVLTGAESPSAESPSRTPGSPSRTTGSPSRSPTQLLSPERAAKAAKAEPVEHDEDEPASEFGSVRYWGAAIDDSLVPDDA
jgi:serine/threonine-protein phosphatase 6 regulatory subunit 3